MATMMNDPRPSMRGLRYTDVAIALHWAIALLIFYNLASGLLGAVLPDGFFRFHISSGITILALTVVRIVWRLTHRPPPLLPMSRAEAAMAHTAHFLLYAGMLAMPLSGWAMVSAHPPAGSPGAAWAAAHPADATPSPPPPAVGAADQPPPPPRKAPMIWGLFRLPLIAPVSEIGRTAAGVPQQRAASEQIGTIHAIGGWIMLALALLHIAGALKHQLVDRRRELARMGLGRPEPAAG